MFSNSLENSSLSTNSSRGRRKKQSIFGGPLTATSIQSGSGLTQKTLNFPSTSSNNNEEIVFKRPELKINDKRAHVFDGFMPCASTKVEPSIPNAKRQRIEKVNCVKDEFDLNSSYETSFKVPLNPCNNSSLKFDEKPTPKRGSIGFTKHLVDLTDDKSEYIAKTELDKLKKKDNIDFVDLVRKDLPFRKCINNFNKFTKAAQGKFFYVDPGSSLDSRYSAEIALSAPKMVSCSTPYVHKCVPP